MRNAVLAAMVLCALAGCGGSSGKKVSQSNASTTSTSSAAPTTASPTTAAGTATTTQSAAAPQGCAPPATNDGLKLSKGSATVTVTGGDQPSETFTVRYDSSPFLYLAGRSVHLNFTDFKRSFGVTLQAASFCTGKDASVTISVAKPYHGDCDLTIKGFTDQGIAGEGHCKNLEENFGSTHLDADVSFTATP